MDAMDGELKKVKLALSHSLFVSKDPCPLPPRGDGTIFFTISSTRRFRRVGMRGQGFFGFLALLFKALFFGLSPLSQPSPEPPGARPGPAQARLHLGIGGALAHLLIAHLSICPMESGGDLF